jgi:glutamate N-acetyltransferase/amino-acid N-acetyltransferase
VSVTAAKGFRAAGVTAGLKPSGKPDVALVVNDGAGTAAAVFTTNRVQAAPVLLSREVVRRGRIRAVVLNSGGANACTGAPGRADALATAEAVAKAIGSEPGEIAVASTGLIGVRLDMSRLLPGVAAAAAALRDDEDGGGQAARAIMTTDTVPKEAVRTVSYDGATITIGGMAKGAGMLAPALATMLVVLTTDADAASDHLRFALKQATTQTFDRVDADGCQSTNDSVYLLASGSSGLTLTPGNNDWRRFVDALTDVCADLAKQLVDDAEGASKRIAVVVRTAASEDDALDAAKAIARSALLKCAVHGEDPNWGRVLAALGTSRAGFDPEAVGVAINGVTVCADGCAAGDPAEARRAMTPREITIIVDLHAGAATATVLTTDLTAAYVHENSAYST